MAVVKSKIPNKFEKRKVKAKVKATWKIVPKTANFPKDFSLEKSDSIPTENIKKAIPSSENKRIESVFWIPNGMSPIEIPNCEIPNGPMINPAKR